MKTELFASLSGLLVMVIVGVMNWFQKRQLAQLDQKVVEVTRTLHVVEINVNDRLGKAIELGKDLGGFMQRFANDPEALALAKKAEAMHLEHKAQQKVVEALPARAKPANL